MAWHVQFEKKNSEKDLKNDSWNVAQFAYSYAENWIEMIWEMYLVMHMFGNRKSVHNFESIDMQQSANVH